MSPALAEVTAPRVAVFVVPRKEVMMSPTEVAVVLAASSRMAVLSGRKNPLPTCVPHISRNPMKPFGVK